MRRREFILGLCGAAAPPLVAQAQQSDVQRRIGDVIHSYEEQGFHRTERGRDLEGERDGIARLALHRRNSKRMEFAHCKLPSFSLILVTERE